MIEKIMQGEGLVEIKSVLLICFSRPQTIILRAAEVMTQWVNWKTKCRGAAWLGYERADIDPERWINRTKIHRSQSC